MFELTNAKVLAFPIEDEIFLVRVQAISSYRGFELSGFNVVAMQYFLLTAILNEKRFVKFLSALKILHHRKK